MEWTEVPCGQNLTTAMIIQIQKALKVKDHDTGSIDDIVGASTVAAILQFQKDHDSVTINLSSIERLKSLGVIL